MGSQFWIARHPRHIHAIDQVSRPFQRENIRVYIGWLWLTWTTSAQVFVDRCAALMLVLRYQSSIAIADLAPEEHSISFFSFRPKHRPNQAYQPSS
jgi:hypothetical protein